MPPLGLSPIWLVKASVPGWTLSPERRQYMMRGAVGMVASLAGTREALEKASSQASRGEQEGLVKDLRERR